MILTEYEENTLNKAKSDGLFAKVDLFLDDNIDLLKNNRWDEFYLKRDKESIPTEILRILIKERMIEFNDDNYYDIMKKCPDKYLEIIDDYNTIYKVIEDRYSCKDNFPDVFKEIGNSEFLLKSIEKNKKINSVCFIKSLKKKEENISSKENIERIDFSELDVLKDILINEKKSIYDKIASEIGIQNTDTKVIDKVEKVSIEFSYDNEKKFCQGHSIGEIIEKIDDFSGEFIDVHNLPRDEQNIIDNINKIKHGLINNSEKTIQDAINDILCEGGIKCVNSLFAKKVIVLLRYVQGRASEDVVLGEFSKEKNSITLYLKNIYDSVKNKDELLENLFSVYAHELFHAYHAIVASSWPDNQEAKIVKESLASFFESKYSKQDFKNSWISHDMFVWPYSGAKYYTDRYGLGYSFTKNLLFRKVFNESLEDFNKAFTTLKYFYDLEHYDM